MENITKNRREVRVKRPFLRVLPDNYGDHGTTINKKRGITVRDTIRYQIVTQADFLREYDPSAHLIFNRDYYPDVWREDPETHRWHKEEVPRYAFAFQSIITTKHLTHLCGSDIQFQLAKSKISEEDDDNFSEFKEGWSIKNCEDGWYKFAKSIKVTGDGAWVAYLNKGKFGWRVFSYIDGDILYPHYDSYTGELDVLAREYKDFDENGENTTTFIDVWDNEYYYRLKQYEAPKKKKKGAKDTEEEILDAFIGEDYVVSGFKIVSKKPHGFKENPAVYYRNEDGACWTKSQDSIDNYELAFSRLAQNNHVYGTPILFLKGEGVEVVGDPQNAVKAIVSNSADGDAQFLTKQDASSSYSAELEKLYNMIYEQSFAVPKIENRSGDLPSSTIKMLFSPAIEKAMQDAQEMDECIDKMAQLFAYGYGLEKNKSLVYTNLGLTAWIEPYIHQNETERVNLLATGVQNKFLSKKTASERNTTWSNNNEYQRIQMEIETEAQHDVLVELQKTMAEQRLNASNPQPVKSGDAVDLLSDVSGIDIETALQANDIDPKRENKDVGGDMLTNYQRPSTPDDSFSQKKMKSERQWDENGNEINPETGKAYSKWAKYNANRNK